MNEKNQKILEKYWTGTKYEIPAGVSIGEVYGPAMEIESESIAEKYFDGLVECVRESMKNDPKAMHRGMTPEDVVRENLGYYAGYYGDETRRRVEQMYRCEHPIFGSIERNGSPTPEAAFDMGKKMAKAMDSLKSGTEERREVGMSASVNEVRPEGEGAYQFMDKLFAWKSSSYAGYMDSDVKVVGYDYDSERTPPLCFRVRFDDGTEAFVYPEEVSRRRPDWESE